MSTNQQSDDQASQGLSTKWPIRKYTSSNTAFPYTAEDLTPMDTRPDTEFYSTPRFVTHIDDHAIAVLKEYYGSVLPHGPSDDSSSTSKESTDQLSKSTPNILDLCSSWISHYPPSLEEAAASRKVAIAGIGLNGPELAANPLFRRNSSSTAEQSPGEQSGARYLVRDLNASPSVPSFASISQDEGASSSPSAAAEGQKERKGPKEDEESPDRGSIDATTLTVSIDYLTSPVTVLESIHRHTNEGGTLHVAVSNRCFPTKAVRKWLTSGEQQRLDMVAEMLVWSGWKDIEILCLCDGSLGSAEGGGEEDEGDAGVLGRMLQGMGLQSAGRRVDPLWIVRGRKKTVDE